MNYCLCWTTKRGKSRRVVYTYIETVLSLAHRLVAKGHAVHIYPLEK